MAASTRQLETSSAPAGGERKPIRVTLIGDWRIQTRGFRGSGELDQNPAIKTERNSHPWILLIASRRTRALGLCHCITKRRVDRILNLLMPASDGDFLNAMIRRTVADHSRSASDARAVAEATLVIWQRISDGLAPVIGVRGVDVLFARAVLVTSRSYPCLAQPAAESASDTPIERLRMGLTACDNLAIEASCVLLVTFTELLASLIGNSLTARLTAPAWVSQRPASEEERADV